MTSRESDKNFSFEVEFVLRAARDAVAKLFRDDKMPDPTGYASMLTPPSCNLSPFLRLSLSHDRTPVSHSGRQMGHSAASLLMEWTDRESIAGDPSDTSFTHIRKCIESRVQEYLIYLRVLHKLKKSSKPIHLSSNLGSVNANCTADATQVCSFQRRSSLDEDDPRDKRRYLCVSDGFVIHCLDLKRGKDESRDYGQPLPVVDTINLLERGLPVSMGLFKLGSDAYMVGGQEFPGFKHHPDLKLPHGLYKKYGFMGSSRKTYHLSLAYGKLSLIECDNIPLLKKPKIWPIVEKIGGRIHVFDSIPRPFEPPYTIPSHEVLNLKDLGSGWMKLPPMRDPTNEAWGIFMTDHLVVGDRIYAKAYDLYENIAVFEPEMGKWELHPEEEDGCGRNLTDFLGFHSVICVGKFSKEDGEYPCYVVIDIHTERIGSEAEDKTTKIMAVAYLVTETRQVVCSQDLPHLFGELIKVPSSSLQACLFRLDEQEDTFGALVRGVHAVEEDEKSGEDFLFISTFTVMQVAGKRTRSPYSAVVEDDATQFVPGKDDFVTVLVKDQHLLKVGSNWMGEAHTRLSACFLIDRAGSGSG